MFTGVLKESFAAQRDYIVKRIEEFNRVEKADQPRITEAQLYAILAYSLEDLVAPTEQALVDAGLAGVLKGLQQIQVADHAAIVTSQDLARQWARERSAEMVGMKWVNGSLVTNPNAQWAISDTTRDEIRRLVGEAFATETPIGDLIESIKGSNAFSDARADLIATTEVARAQTKGTLQVWQKTGVVLTAKWAVSSLGCCDECEENAAAGPVEVGEPYPSGDDAPPGHPRCRCFLVAVKIQPYGSLQTQ